MMTILRALRTGFRHRAARVAAVLMCLFLSSAAAASAAVITIDVQAFIDGRSLLVIQGSTVQWHNLSWTVPGKHNGHNDPTIFTTTLDGNPVMTNYGWMPNWPGGQTGNVWSDTFTGLAPALPNVDMTVSLLPILARHSLSIYQLPNAGNGYTLIIDFDDDPVGGSTWYRAELTIDYTYTPPAPEPAGLMLLGSALAGLASVVRRRR